MNGSSGEPAVRYSEAQLAMLATLGLVPWVRRVGTAVAPDAPPAAAPAPSPARQPTSSTRPAIPPSLATPPDAIVARAVMRDGLAGRPLVGFARRGERRHDTGPDGAAVLVLAEPVPGVDVPERLPLAPADADLLQAMLRAIDLGAGDHATALLATDTADGEAASEALVVGDRLAGRRAVIWLCHDEIDADPIAPPDDPLDGVPVFRIAHPAVLRARPAVKRDAWQTLKRVRARLSMPVAGAPAVPPGERR